MAASQRLDPKTYDAGARVQATVKYVFNLTKRNLAGARGTVFEKHIIVASVEIAGQAQQPSPDDELEVYFIDEVRSPPTMRRSVPRCARAGRARARARGFRGAPAGVPRELRAVRARARRPAASTSPGMASPMRDRSLDPTRVLSRSRSGVLLARLAAGRLVAERARPCRSGPRRATSWTRATSYS